MLKLLSFKALFCYVVGLAMIIVVEFIAMTISQSTTVVWENQSCSFAPDHIHEGGIVGGALCPAVGQETLGIYDTDLNDRALKEGFGFPITCTGVRLNWSKSLVVSCELN